MIEVNPLWGKYSLSINEAVRIAAPLYAEAVGQIHNEVVNYLEQHALEQNGYLQKKEGFLYFDIARRAVGDECLEYACVLAQQASEQVRQFVGDVTFRAPAPYQSGEGLTDTQ